MATAPKHTDDRGCDFAERHAKVKDLPAHEMLAWVRLALSNVKRRDLGTPLGIRRRHLDRHPSEWAFPWN